MLFEEIDLFMWYYSFLQNYNCTHLSFWSYQVNKCKDIIIPAYVLDGSADSHIYLTYELLDCSSGKMFMLILNVLTCSINKLHMSEQRLYLSLLLDIPYWHFLQVDSKYARIARVAVMLRLSDSDTSSSRNSLLSKKLRLDCVHLTPFRFWVWLFTCSMEKKKMRYYNSTLNWAQSCPVSCFSLNKFGLNFLFEV